MRYFWFVLSWAAVIWYSTITVYVAYKGLADIRGMLARLQGKRDSAEESE